LLEEEHAPHKHMILDLESEKSSQANEWFDCKSDTITKKPIFVLGCDDWYHGTSNRKTRARV